MLKSYQIKYISPNKRIIGQERKSKLLEPNSELYKECQRIRDFFLEKYPNQIKDKRMDFHTELIFRGEEYSEELLNNRSKRMDGMDIYQSDFNLERLGKQALVINTPKIDDKQPHITIVFFKESIPNDWTIEELKNYRSKKNLI